jgi:hypothetical protein
LGLVTVVLAAFAAEVDGGTTVAVLATADVEGTCFVARSGVATALGGDCRGVGGAWRENRTGEVRPIAEQCQSRASEEETQAEKPEWREHFVLGSQ